MKALHEEPGYMSADPLLHRDNLDQRPPEERESGALGSDQPESPKITLDREEASIYVRVIRPLSVLIYLAVGDLDPPAQIPARFRTL